MLGRGVARRFLLMPNLVTSMCVQPTNQTLQKFLSNTRSTNKSWPNYSLVEEVCIVVAGSQTKLDEEGSGHKVYNEAGKTEWIQDIYCTVD